MTSNQDARKRREREEAEHRRNWDVIRRWCGGDVIYYRGRFAEVEETPSTQEKDNAGRKRTE